MVAFGLAVGLMLALVNAERWRAGWKLVAFGVAALAVVLTGWFFVGTQLFHYVVVPVPADRPGGFAADRASAPPEPPVHAFQLRSDELEQRGQLGDMFGVVGSLISAVALVGVAIGLYYQQSQLRQHDDTERKRDRESKERLLLEIMQRYWSPEFYALRHEAWEMANLVLPILEQGSLVFSEDMVFVGDDIGKITKTWNDSRLDGVVALNTVLRPLTAAHAVSAHRTLITCTLIKWMTIGNVSNRKDLISQVSDYIQRHDDAIRSKRMTGILLEERQAEGDTPYHKLAEEKARKMVSSLSQVLNVFGAYSSVWVQEKKEPLTDFMGNQWHWWGPFMRKFIEQCQTVREKLKQKSAFWEEPLIEYDRRYNARARPSPPASP